MKKKNSRDDNFVFLYTFSEIIIRECTILVNVTYLECVPQIRFFLNKYASAFIINKDVGFYTLKPVHAFIISKYKILLILSERCA